MPISLAWYVICSYTIKMYISVHALYMFIVVLSFYVEQTNIYVISYMNNAVLNLKVFFSFDSNTTNVSSWIGTANLPGAPEVTSDYYRACFAQSLVFCEVNPCLPYFHLFFNHCFVCLSSIYGFWLTLWYPQIFLSSYKTKDCHILILRTPWIKYVLPGTKRN